MVDSLWIRVESLVGPGESHRIVVTVSDVVIVVSSTAMQRILAIADTMSQTAVRPPCSDSH